MEKMKLTNKHFEIFKRKCKKWQDKFELHNWELHFRWQEKNGDRAGLSTSLDGYVSTALLTKEWDNWEKITEKDIEVVAKHEMIHLLLSRLEIVGRARYISEDEQREATEELVRKLENIIH